MFFFSCFSVIYATQLNVDKYNYNSVTISYSEGSEHYEIYRSTNNKKYYVIKDTTDTTYTNSKLTFNKTYYYKVKSYNIVNGIKVYNEESNIVKVKTKLNKTTAKVLPYSSSSNKLKISYSKVPGASYYQIYESTNGKKYKLKKTTKSLSYVRSGLKQNKVYYYKVRSYKIYKGKKYYSSYTYVNTRTIPWITYNLSNNGYEEVKLSINTSSNASGYKIYRSTSYDGPYTYLGKTITNTYVDTKVSPNKKYYYRIRAYRTIDSIDYDGSYSYKKVITTKELSSSDYPTFSINYPTNELESVLLTVTTDSSNLISFNNGVFSNTNTITLNDNVTDYIIRVKNLKGLISEKKITITNIKHKTQKDINNDLIEQIYNTFGFRVEYGEEEKYCYAGETCVALTDESKAYTALNSLIKASSEYPSGFFRTFIGNNGYRVTLFDDIPGDVAGLASYEFGNDNRMLIDVNSGFLGRVLYHETWHIIEKYIEYESYGKTNPFSDWADMNPDGFTYGQTYTEETNNDNTAFDTRLVQHSLGEFQYKSEIAFISPYAKSAPHEDRAELFADLMFRPYKKNYMESGFAINTKAIRMSNILDEYFENTTNANWKRWISFE